MHKILHFVQNDIRLVSWIPTQPLSRGTTNERELNCLNGLNSLNGSNGLNYFLLLKKPIATGTSAVPGTNSSIVLVLI
jgi:hypothetical protein